GFGGTDRLAGQQQPAGSAVTDQFRQQCRLDDRGDADPDLGHPEYGALAGDPQVTGAGEFEAGTKCITVDPRDDRDGQPAERVAAAMDQRNEVTRAVPMQRRDLTDVGAADKGASPGAR